MNDPEIRERLHAHFDREGTPWVDEVRLNQRRIDMLAMVDDVLTAIEIKSAKGESQPNPSAAASRFCGVAEKLTALEICAGGGGQALGIEQAGFDHVALVEIDEWACATLRNNRPDWHVVQTDLREYSGSGLEGIDLLAGGVPCPPFSLAGKQLGEDDERDLFPEALRLVEACTPRAVMLENVRGLLDRRFDDYRRAIEVRLLDLGYEPKWQLLNASDFGVPQLRPRVVLVALRADLAAGFQWPGAAAAPPPTVGEALLGAMAQAGWKGASTWASQANEIAPTLVGGSKKHGGPDLGPTRAKRQWAKLGVCAKGIADSPPSEEFVGMPRLTVEMAALIQGFPSEWRFAGRKTAAYRQVGNAFPPPVAAAVAGQIRKALSVRASTRRSSILAA